MCVYTWGVDLQLTPVPNTAWQAREFEMRAGIIIIISHDSRPLHPPHSPNNNHACAQRPSFSHACLRYARSEPLSCSLHTSTRKACSSCVHKSLALVPCSSCNFIWCLEALA